MKKIFPVLVLVFMIQQAAAGVLPMRHFSVDEGLVNNEVLTLYQDSKGYIWFGTYEGLSRFDGKEFKNFTEENTNIAGSIIRSITEDAQGNLWVGFIGGIARMSGNTFFNYTEADGLTGNDVISLFPDPEAGLWILTDQGVNYFDGEKFSFYLLDGINTEVYAPMLAGSPDGEIFVIDKYGLSHKRPDQDGFENLMQLSGGIRAIQYHDDALYILTASELYRRQGDNLSAVAKSELEEILDTLAFGKSGVWIASVSEIFQPEKIKYTNEMLGEPAITNIMEDREGNLWAASWSGVSMIVNAGIINYSLPFKTVTAIAETKENIWTAGDKGLVKLDPDGSRVKYIESPYVEFMAICGDTVFSCTEDMLTLYNFNGEIISETEGESYTAIHQAADFIWLGSYNGLYRMTAEGKPKKFIDSGTGLGSNTVWAVYRDKKGRLWIGTENGLSMMFNDSWNHYTAENSGLPHDSVWTITEHETWGVLFGTTGGIAVWKDGRFEILPQLAGKMVDNLLIDSNSRLWAGSTKGVYRFSQGGADILLLDKSRGLPANQMYFRTITEIDGSIFVGSNRGLTGINANIQNNKTTNPLMEITGAFVNQEPMPAKLDIPLKHDKNNITFEFSAIYTYLPESVVYSYHLSGMDSVWRSDVLRKATYTNIPPGKYKFQVQALAEAGKKSAVRSVGFTILKPFWLEWWFIALEILAGLIVVALAAHLVSRIRLRKSEAEKARLQALYDKQLELDALKDDFLANTSHELRTPLNGIIGITDSLLDGAGGEVPPLIHKNLIMVSSSGKRLLRLVNDILDFSTLKKREMTLEPEPVDVHQITETVLNLSQGLIGDKPLKLINAVSPHLPMAHADSAKLEQVLINLVGNAVKFTNDGHVKVSAALDTEGALQVQVEDTGLGIVAEKLKSIFEAFEQVESHETRKFEGTGIGLSITKQIVELHGGKIWAESEPGEGTVFFFTLPVTSESAPKQNVAAPAPEPAAPETEPAKEFDGRRTQKFNPPPPGTGERRKEIQVLAVDDEPTNLQVISNYLTPVNVSVTKALNGMEALDLLESEFKPDCILLDVMMPKMSGFEVCEKIRETHPAAELPIIILTAKNQTSDLVKGFQAGASDYLTKPFVKDELLARIKTHTDLIRIVDKLIASTADREAINKELEVARRIQMNFLPKDFLSNRSEFELHAMMEPAKQVGGDLYDFFFLDERRLCFVIGDVSDKGVPAALFMVTAKTLIKAIADNPAFHEPAKLVSELNRILNWDNPRSMFITLIVAVIDLETGAVDYCNGGHNPPLYLGTNGGQEYLKAKSGPFVGPFAGLQYKPLQHSLKPGEALLFYTDGVTEAMNPNKAEFGEDKLTAVVEQSKASPVEEIIKAVISEVKNHAGDEPQSDDITMLAIRYNGPGETE